MIAMGLSCNPQLLIADEPTTALDVTTQAQIMDLMLNLADERGTAVMLITHDLGVVAGFCDTLQVMYAGTIVERGSADEIYYDPQHPYTWGLLGIDDPPRRGAAPAAPFRARCAAIAHQSPQQDAASAPRCDFAIDLCGQALPMLRPSGGPNQEAACHRATELDLKSIDAAAMAEEVAG